MASTPYTRNLTAMLQAAARAKVEGRTFLGHAVVDYSDKRRPSARRIIPVFSSRRDGNPALLKFMRALFRDGAPEGPLRTPRLTSFKK